MAISTPNIALIKYWGNRNNELRLPMADSLSMTLDQPTVEITVEDSDTLQVHSFTMGKELEVTEKHLSRFEKHLNLTKQYLRELSAPDALPASLRIDIQSHIPPGIGLASSAAVFSCLAKAIREFIQEKIVLTDEQTSVIARLGSGSAARSVMSGYVALLAGEGDGIDSSFARQIANADHWVLHDIVIVPSHEEKKVGSTEGHAIAHTSPHFADRIKAIRTRRQRDCTDAILQRDFEKLQAVAEEDSFDMHHVMETSNPPLHYLTDVTHRIIRDIKTLRTAQHLPVLFTMDAGPTVHLVCTEEAVRQIKEFARIQEGCSVFETKVG